MEENVWFDFDKAMKELKTDENKLHLEPSKKEEVKEEPQQSMVVPFYDFSQDPIFRKREARKRLEKRIAENDKVAKETKNLKIFDTLPKKIISIVIAGTLVGVVGFMAKVSDKSYVDNISTPAIEQEYDENAISKANDLVKEDRILSQDEVKLVQDVNNGMNYEAPAVGQFGTNQGYTPLSKDPNYKEPNLEELRQNVYEEVTLDKAMDKFQKGEALTEEEANMIKEANINPKQAPVGHFEGEPLVEQGKTI